MLAQFIDIFFAESNKRLASQPASQPNLLYKRKNERKPGYRGILSFGSRASLVLFFCGSEGVKIGKWVFRRCRKE